MKKSRVPLYAATVAATASAVVVLASPAFAHVSVQPEGEAAKGGYATIGFKVPNERDDASTTKLEVTFPGGQPLASVLPQPVPGWKAEVTKGKLDKPLKIHGNEITEAVTKVTWTADGKGIEPGFFQRFPVSVGQLPEKGDELVFKAVQTYSNKEVVRWIEVPGAGGEEPQFPAPVLALSEAEDDHHGSGDDDKAEDKATATAGSKDAEAKDDKADGHDGHESSSAAGSDDSDTTARVLGVTGIVVGLLGAAFGVFASRRKNSTG